jgi:uncharacterized protein
MSDCAAMSAGALAVVALIVLCAATVQVIAGFAFALLAVPLMTLVIPTRQAVVVSTLIGCLMSAWQAWHQRADADRRAVRDLVIAAYLGMPVGLAIFVVVSDSILQLLLGVSIVAAVVLLSSRRDISASGPGLEYGAGFLSGLLNTSLATNGPPLVFALQSRRLPAQRFRGTISMVFALCSIGAVTAFVLAGKVDRDGLVAAAVALPAMLLGHAIGWPLRRRIDERRFRHLVLGLLLLAAASAITAAL